MTTPPVDPTEIIGEILGEPAALGANPASNGYICPFTTEKCIKARGKLPLPVCSVWRGGRLVVICPNRLRQRDLISDVLDTCWTAAQPTALEIAPEVQMQGFGNVDFVVADVANDEVLNFVSVEAQAVDVTNSYRPAYNAIIAGQMLTKSPTFSLNWDNVYKRYMTQVIRKGFYHHHWNTKIIALMQDELFKQLCKYPFLTTNDVADPAVNVVFLLYKYDLNTSPYSLVIDRRVGTSHANLSQAALYAKAPSREAFVAKIMASIKKSKKLAGKRAKLPDFNIEPD